jgi:hypothetical protein
LRRLMRRVWEPGVVSDAIPFILRGMGDGKKRIFPLNDLPLEKRYLSKRLTGHVVASQSAVALRPRKSMAVGHWEKVGGRNPPCRTWDKAGMARDILIQGHWPR